MTVSQRLRTQANVLNRFVMLRVTTRHGYDNDAAKAWIRRAERGELAPDEQGRYLGLLTSGWTSLGSTVCIALLIIGIAAHLLHVASRSARNFGVHGIGVALGVCGVGALDAVWRYWLIWLAQERQEQAHGEPTAASLRLARLSRAVPAFGLIAQMIAGCYVGYRL